MELYARLEEAEHDTVSASSSLEVAASLSTKTLILSSKSAFDEAPTRPPTRPPTMRRLILNSISSLDSLSESLDNEENEFFDTLFLVLEPWLKMCAVFGLHHALQDHRRHISDDPDQCNIPWRTMHTGLICFIFFGCSCLYTVCVVFGFDLHLAYVPAHNALWQMIMTLDAVLFTAYGLAYLAAALLLRSRPRLRAAFGILLENRHQVLLDEVRDEYAKRLRWFWAISFTMVILSQISSGLFVLIYQTLTGNSSAFDTIRGFVLFWLIMSFFVALSVFALFTQALILVAQHFTAFFTDMDQYSKFAPFVISAGKSHSFQSHQHSNDSQFLSVNEQESVSMTPVNMQSALMESPRDTLQFCLEAIRRNRIHLSAACSASVWLVSTAVFGVASSAVLHLSAAIALSSFASDDVKKMSMFRPELKSIVFNGISSAIVLLALLFQLGRVSREFVDCVKRLFGECVQPLTVHMKQNAWLMQLLVTTQDADHFQLFRTPVSMVAVTRLAYYCAVVLLFIGTQVQVFFFK
jgi:hypothetical protein